MTVHKNGQVVIGTAYTAEIRLQPGDEYQIKLDYKHIHLVKFGKDDPEE